MVSPEGYICNQLKQGTVPSVATLLPTCNDQGWLQGQAGVQGYGREEMQDSYLVQSAMDQ